MPRKEFDCMTQTQGDPVGPIYIPLHFVRVTVGSFFCGDGDQFAGAMSWPKLWTLRTLRMFPSILHTSAERIHLDEDTKCILSFNLLTPFE